MINKKDLEMMTFSSAEETQELASRIEDGTYEKVKLKVPAEVPTLEKEILKIANSFYSGLRKLSSSSDNVRIKAVLSAHIDKLEEMYKQM
ncbi:MAG: hypothetical protein FWF85_01485 [Clostridiales bacterium]|nr:hypothetical protein [Clostridiales bacterium]